MSNEISENETYFVCSHGGSIQHPVLVGGRAAAELVKIYPETAIVLTYEEYLAKKREGRK